jgi:hypothetical protein
MSTAYGMARAGTMYEFLKHGSTVHGTLGDPQEEIHKINIYFI